MEKRYYCKILDGNEPGHHVTSRTVVIKLEISKFINKNNTVG